jgi:hypothetical protein
LTTITAYGPDLGPFPKPYSPATSSSTVGGWSRPEY